MLMMMRRSLLWACAALASAAMSFGALIFWPDPLFAFSLRAGKIIVASDRPIPPAGGERFLRDCERLLERSPLKAKSHQYRLYVTNDDWRQRLFFIPRPERWGFAWYYGLGGPALMSGADCERGVGPWGVGGRAPADIGLSGRRGGHSHHCLGAGRAHPPARAAMGMGGSARLCRHREPGDVRAAAGRACRPACRYSDAGQIWQLPALSAAGDVLHREKRLVLRSALANKTDRRRGDRHQACRQGAMRAMPAEPGHTSIRAAAVFGVDRSLLVVTPTRSSPAACWSRRTPLTSLTMRVATAPMKAMSKG